MTEIQTMKTPEEPCQYVGMLRLSPDIWIIVGSKGRLRLERPFKPEQKEKLHIYSDTQTLEVLVECPKTLYALQLEHFAKVLRDKATPRISLQDSLKNIHTLKSLLESAEKGQPLTL